MLNTILVVTTTTKYYCSYITTTTPDALAAAAWNFSITASVWHWDTGCLRSLLWRNWQHVIVIHTIHLPYLLCLLQSSQKMYIRIIVFHVTQPSKLLQAEPRSAMLGLTMQTLWKIAGDLLPVPSMKSGIFCDRDSEVCLDAIAASTSLMDQTYCGGRKYI